MTINYKENTERNFHSMTAEQVEYLSQNNMTVDYDEEMDMYIIYDDQGNDIDMVHSMIEFEF